MLKTNFDRMMIAATREVIKVPQVSWDYKFVLDDYKITVNYGKN